MSIIFFINKYIYNIYLQKNTDIILDILFIIQYLVSYKY
jgi:hypothetical protein